MQIKAEPLSAAAFAPFGDVLDATGAPDKIINQGLCGRFHDRARLDFGAETGGRAGISIFQAEARALPYLCDLLERHPEGSQAFIPMTADPFLVIVAPDAGGRPGAPRAFLTNGAQAINLHRGTWHGVLTPIGDNQDFLVVDRGGDGSNLEEFHFSHPYEIHLPREFRA